MKILIAPIAGVTDYPFRLILKEYSPDRLFTEMVSANAIVMGNQKTLEELLYLEDDPSVQLFGGDPMIMAEAAQYIQSRGVKHLDINMGCPMKKIIQNGYGSALLKDIKQAEKIIAAIRDKTTLTLSIKIRIGYQEISNPLGFAKLAQEYGCSFITIHGRTREQLYSGSANWEIIRDIKKQVDIPVIGNGDLFTPEVSVGKWRESGVDGIMLARGIFGSPWLIEQIRSYEKTGSYHVPSLEEKLEIAKKHLQFIEQYKGSHKALYEGRKHLCWYLKGISRATTLKQEINHASAIEQVYEMLEEFKKGV